MTHLITYATENMSKAAQLCVESGKNNGVDWGYFKRSTFIEPYFISCNQSIFESERGAGYWLWKPYIIGAYLARMAEGEILIYSDAGVEFINNVSHIIEKMDQDIFLFGNNWNHVDWCKGDVMQAIPSQIQTTDKQVQASVIFIRNTERSRKFVKEWLLYCQMPGLIDDSPSATPNYPTFQEHRHDQAILTQLAYKYGIKLHWWPATYNNGAFNYEKLPCYSSDNYPIIFHHHRLRDNEFDQYKK
ncbi:hypothetical protein UFOVP402_8 [uncultured Caudovirales phage]|uniref:Uncharacterized protein n=1 Tax=uncultured Caudovirales phage TaxID=2100421 RepID=A0A6J5M515_9CAUD|nr:hypothetical protein UFOVP402_8 [uncultured Caudovirales phage]